MTKETVNQTEKNMYRYGLQEKLCNLYEQSKQGKTFKHRICGQYAFKIHCAERKLCGYAQAPETSQHGVSPY